MGPGEIPEVSTVCSTEKVRGQDTSPQLPFRGTEGGKESGSTSGLRLKLVVLCVVLGDTHLCWIVGGCLPFVRKEHLVRV